MKLRTILVCSFAGIVFTSSMAEAKVISPSAEKGENKIYIRADGLACYFCAYGMERFFKQSGKIAWYDMDMKKGVVEVGFIKGKPILDVKTLKQYVHDAGFSPREIKAELAGRLTQTNDGYRFQVTETGQSFPVEANSVVQETKELVGREVILTAIAKEAQGAPFKLVPEVIRPRGSVQ